MVNGDSKGVNNKDVQFGFIASLGKDYNGHCTFVASPQEVYDENFDLL